MEAWEGRAQLSILQASGQEGCPKGWSPEVGLGALANLSEGQAAYQRSRPLIIALRFEGSRSCSSFSSIASIWRLMLPILPP